MNPGLATEIENTIQRKEETADEVLVRAKFARVLIDELMPHLPRTLEDFFEIDQVWIGAGTPPDGTVQLLFRTRINLPSDDAPQAFGTIVKAAGALLRAGWRVKPQPKIEAMSYTKALHVEIEGERDVGRFHIQFSHLPESERCKLVEEQVLVPSRYETKLRVVCEGQPVQIVGSPALPEQVQRPVATVSEAP